jgi:hypothetical protein
MRIAAGAVFFTTDGAVAIRYWGSNLPYAALLAKTISVIPVIKYLYIFIVLGF